MPEHTEPKATKYHVTERQLFLQVIVDCDISRDCDQTWIRIESLTQSVDVKTDNQWYE